jgi:phospholipase/carboxylesterase
MASITGPRLPPRSGRARQLVVFLHGYGADGGDLLAIGREWSRLLPDAAFVAPNAPERCVMSGAGFQWFGLTFRDPDERWNGVRQARPVLDAFLDAELKAQGLSDSQLALVGFSQGTMMALHTGLRRRAAPGAILGYSGTLEGADQLAAEATGKPPVLLVHGEADEVIPVEALFMATDALAAASIPVQWHLSLGVGHGIDPEGLKHGGEFLAQSFAGKPGSALARG